eukprot:12263636-Alexandrium_andersonii.AAC.1
MARVRRVRELARAAAATGTPFAQAAWVLLRNISQALDNDLQVFGYERVKPQAMQLHNAIMDAAFLILGEQHRAPATAWQ